MPSIGRFVVKIGQKRAKDGPNFSGSSQDRDYDSRQMGIAILFPRVQSKRNSMSNVIVKKNNAHDTA